MFVSEELVGPNPCPNWSRGKGKQVKIPVLYVYVRQRKASFRHFGLHQQPPSRLLNKINLLSIVTMRRRLNYEQRPYGSFGRCLESMKRKHARITYNRTKNQHWCGQLRKLRNEGLNQLREFDKLALCLRYKGSLRLYVQHADTGFKDQDGPTV